MAKQASRLPAGLLKDTARKRLQYFRDYIVKHQLLVEAYNDLIDAVVDPEPETVIYVFGPSGVGKTTLLSRVVKQLIEIASPNDADKRWQVPVVMLQAIAPRHGGYSWTDFLVEALHALEDPFIGTTAVRYRNDDSGSTVETKRPTADKSGKGDVLLHTYERGVSYRKPLAVIIDNAHHFTIVASGRKLKDQTEFVKTLAIRTTVPYVLSGTYDLLRLLNRSGQLARRTIKIHFQRYTEDKFQNFVDVLGSFQYKMPLLEEPDLVQHASYFFEGSLGCVGLLKEWLNRALRLALKENARTLTSKHISRAELPQDDFEELQKEIAEGEEDIESRMRRSPSRPQLGGNGSSCLNASTRPVSEGEANKPLRQSRKRKAVGTPKPKRHPVGRKKGVPVDKKSLPGENHMSGHKFTVLESLDLTQPTIISRTHLYDVQPVGIGTADVESLTSYIGRVAEAHCVSTGTLFARKLSAHVGKDYLVAMKNSTVFAVLHQVDTQAINGISQISEGFVYALETLTRRNGLRFLTMQTWKEAISTRNLLRATRAWCSQCFEQWRDTGSVIYEPLLWALNVIKACPRHRRRLQFRCPECEKQLAQFSRSFRPGYCPRCHCWLGRSLNALQDGSEPLTEKEIEWQAFAANLVGELVAAAPGLPAPPKADITSKPECMKLAQIVAL
jgi:GTPase SAR1 family protein